MESVGTPILWIGFTLFVLAMLALDLGVFHRKAHVVGIREALVLSAIWIGLALLFNAGVWIGFGSETAMEFITGYIIEKTLSVDNLFVFLVIFSYFAVPPQLQHRVLFWGILGALITRVIFIVVGAALLQMFHWIMYLFGGFLVITGIKLLLQHGEEVHPERNPIVRLFQKIFPLVGEYREASFFVVEGGRRYATPLLLALVAIEATDIVFAVDSIPAIFAITSDPFIVYTSNVFAILGLRALYFALAGIMQKFHHLKIGLAWVLVFVGIKMLIADFYKIPILLSLSVVVVLLGGSLVASLLIRPKEPLSPPSTHGPESGGDG